VVLVLGVENPFAGRYTLYTYLPNISGLRSDSPVMLDGVTVGNIDSYQFAELDKGIRIKMRILKGYQDRIRTDSIAKLRSLGLLGDKYIEINQGTANGRVLKEGETVTGAPPLDLDQMIARATHTFDNVSDTVDNIKTITQGLEDGKGTLGRLLRDDNIHNNLNGILDKVNNGKGTLGSMISDKQLYDELRATAGNLRAATEKINKGEGAAGKLIADKEVGDKIAGSVNKLDAILARMESGEGTFGKLSTDPALYNNLNTVMSNLKPVTDSISKGEGTVGQLLKNKELYDNSNKVMQEMLLLVKDVRNDPKKYLRVKFSIF
jgi:phospholipid/cholesterol/gamma-HCH transport system substrate-binding protein